MKDRAKECRDKKDVLDFAIKTSCRDVYYVNRFGLLAENKDKKNECLKTLETLEKEIKECQEAMLGNGLKQKR